MFANLQRLIDGSMGIAKNAHVDCGQYFINKDYKQIIPGSAEDAPRDLLREYYERDNIFSLTPLTLKQLRTVYKADGDLNIGFAASFFIVELD